MAGVAIFAIDKGMVEAKEPLTEVVIFNTNTRKKIKALVKVKRWISRLFRILYILELIFLYLAMKLQ